MEPRIRFLTRGSVAVALSIVFLASALIIAFLVWIPATPNSPAGSQQKVGLLLNDPRAYQGYTLLAPLTSTSTYLLDMEGRVVHQWESNCRPALSAYLLENGHLLRTGVLPQEKRPFGGTGAGGRIQEFTWDGELVWDYSFVNDKQLPHHDITRLPNGNVLMIVWQTKTGAEAVAAGRRPDAMGNRSLRSDSILEVQPTGKTTGKIVWEWHIWDHLVQDLDASKSNYGDVAGHSERIDINFGGSEGSPALSNSNFNRLRSIGYVSDGPAGRPPLNPDWTHINSVAYNADLNQIVLSVLGFNEIWIVDHETTTAEAAGHTGGRGGKGGDLLYRWGNPRAYHMGTEADQRLFGQHSAHWIAHGLKGEGHLLIFNNGPGRPEGRFSSVDEIVLPLDTRGRYSRPPGAAFGPEDIHWSYKAANQTEFFSELISGAQRLPNGNTIICSGTPGVIFEVTGDEEVVWAYTMPFHRGQGPAGGVRNSLFRVQRYASNYSGLAGKDLTPGKRVEELLGEPARR